MNRRMDMDQRITAWLEAEAGPAGAGYLEETLVLLDRTPQRRWRGALLRAVRLPAEWRPPVVPRRVVLAGIVALLVLALVVAALLVGSQRRLPPPFGLADNGLIAYDDGRNVYLAESDGSGQREIPGGLGFEWNGTFSPDGTLVAFWSAPYYGQRPALFVAPVDGSRPATQLSAVLTMDDPNFVPPAWSPDSRQIAFAGFASGGRRGILVADVATPDSTRYVAGDRTGAGFPAWSPDGQWIAFRATPEGRTLLVVVRPDGSSWRELRSVDGVVDSFTQIGWSPDGRLVYHRQHEGQTVVAVYDLATDTETVVSDPTWYADAPSWSSDGTRIAYHQEQPSGGDVGEATRELVIATADGTQREVRGPITDCLAKFSPDSRFLIAYAPGCFSASAIVVVDAFDPAAPVRTITLPNSIVGAPSWQRVDDGR